MMQPPTIDRIEPLNMLAMIKIIWRGKWVIILSILIMVTTTGYYAFHIAQPRYAATATLAVDTQRFALPHASPHLTSDMTRLNTQAAAITSHDVLKTIVSTLDLQADPEVNRYLTPLATYSLRNLRMNMRHYFSGTVEPIYDAKAVLEKTIQNLRGMLTVRRQDDTHIFHVTAQSHTASKAILIANTTVTNYIAAQAQVKDAAAQDAIMWLSDRATALQEQLLFQETAITNLISTAQIQNDIGLDIRSNQVLDIDARLGEARAALASLQNRRDDMNTARYQAGITQHTEQITTLIAQRDRLSAQLEAQSTGLMQLHQMQREADATRVLYQTYLARLQETRIQQGLGLTENQFLTPATTSHYVGPRKVLIITIGAVLGICLGLGLVGLQHGLQQGVRDTTVLREATGLPILGQLSYAIRRRVKTSQSEIQKIIMALMAKTNGVLPAVILVASTAPNEDKPHIVTGFAKTLVAAERSVLIMATDAKSSLAVAKHKHSQQSEKMPHITDMITHDDTMSCDILVMHQSETTVTMCLSDRLTPMMADLRNRYDHVIVDAPPVLAGPEVCIFAQYADAILYAVRWSKTPFDLIMQGLNVLRDADLNVSGLIVAKVKNRKHV